MKKILTKYLERLATLKENRSKTADTNSDAENEFYDKLIEQTAEICRDLKTLQGKNEDSSLAEIIFEVD